MAPAIPPPIARAPLIDNTHGTLFIYFLNVFFTRDASENPLFTSLPFISPPFI
jgi:hypothetical protein